MDAMRKLLIVTTLCAAFGPAAACSSGGSGGAHPSADAAKDGPALDAVQESPVDAGDAVVDSGPDARAVGCVPRPVDGGFKYVPPKAREDACTTAQIQALYNACDPGSGSSCTNFHSDPANSSCINCMITKAGTASRGAIFGFPNNIYFPNVGGCMALVDPDAGPGNCPQSAEAFEECVNDSCSTGCNTPLGDQPILSCQAKATSTTCLKESRAYELCADMPAYTPCVFADFEAAFLGLGHFFCEAAPEGGVDAAPDSAPPDAADGAADAGPDAGTDATND